MKKLFYPALLGLSLGGASALWLAACSAGGDGSDGDGVGGQSGGTTGTGKGDASIDVAPDGEKPPGPIDYSDLCGEGVCIPGGANTCNEGTGGGTGGEGGAGGGAGLGGGGGSGTGGAPPLGCQVDVSGIEPEPRCLPVDPLATIGASCVDGSQCAAGNACVVIGGTGSAVCRPYCCSDLTCPTSSTPRTYCAPQPVQGFLTERVPVCTDEVECDPLNDSETPCSKGETCTIVGAGGMTGCVPVGDGRSCDPCPCAEGYMCNLGTGTCQKLCHTTMSDECGGMGGTCQGILPDIGVCIGGDADCGF